MEPLSDKPKRRVAVFQASWILQVHTRNLIESFAERGWDVDLFFYDVDDKFVSDFCSQLPSGVSLHEYPAPHKQRGVGSAPELLAWKWRDAIEFRAEAGSSLPVRFLELLKITKRCGRYLVSRIEWGPLGGLHRMVDPRSVATIRRDARRHVYDLVIGVEALGIALADNATKRNRRLLAYYSLEIEAPKLRPYVVSRSLHRLEARAHRRSDMTLIQDKYRWEVLRRANKVKSSVPIFLPVGLRGESRSTSMRELHQELAIPPGKKIVLSLGFVTESRFFSELLEAAKNLADEWVLVFHGPCLEQERKDILSALSLCPPGKVYWSSTLVDSDRLEQFVASARAGIAFYSDHDANHRHTARASEKMALYAKCGIPAVAFAYPSYIDVFRNYRSGVAVASVAELPAALTKIDANHEDLSAGAREAFEREYAFDRRIGAFYKCLEMLLAREEQKSLVGNLEPASESARRTIWMRH